MTTATKLWGAILLFTALISSGAVTVHAQTTRNEKISKKRGKVKAPNSPYTQEQLNYDAAFVEAATSANMLQVSLGKLAQQKAIVQEVKDWGKTMEKEHTEIGQKLEAVASRNNFAFPTMMGVEDRRIYDDIDDRKYLGFDKKYLRDAQALHERTIKRYAEAATKISSPELLNYVTEMLPKLRAHEAQAAALFERANALK